MATSPRRALVRFAIAIGILLGAGLFKPAFAQSGSQPNGQDWTATTRAAILIAHADDPQKSATYLGNAAWSIIPAVGGQPSTVGVRIEIEIPGQKMHATVTIRKNADATLSATHTIDLSATFGDGSGIKGIKDIDLPRLRQRETPTGEALSGVRVKINDNHFLVGLSQTEDAAAHNIALLARKNWFDFPILLNDDRIAKLTFEKGAVGERVVAEALGRWDDRLRDIPSETAKPQAVSKSPLDALPPPAEADQQNAFAGVHRQTTVSTSTSVPVDKEGSAFVVPVSINDKLTLKFTIDSGSADVSIPADVVHTLWRTGTLNRADFLGVQTFRLADGSMLPSRTFRIRSLKVGDIVLNNVTGNVAPEAGGLLLGQSFLSRFKSWSIDNQRQVLVLELMPAPLVRCDGAPNLVNPLADCSHCTNGCAPAH